MTEEQKMRELFASLRQKSHTQACLQKHEVTGSDLKKCFTCGEDHKLNDFWSMGRGRKTRECKWCRRKKAHKDYAEDGEKMRARIRKYQRKRKLENPRQEILRRTEMRARRKNMEFSLREDDLVWPDYCPVFNIPLVYVAVGAGRALDNSASLDRIDNAKGYCAGNVVVISNRANAIKRDATLEELKSIVRYMEERGVK